MNATAPPPEWEGKLLAACRDVLATMGENDPLRPELACLCADLEKRVSQPT